MFSIHRVGLAVLRLQLLSTVLVGCESSGGASAVGSRSQSVIFGEDDRVELADYPNASRMREITFALVPARSLTTDSEGLVVVDAPPLRRVRSLCQGERFRNQPVASSCSGVLIARDMVLTAGHCFVGLQTCDAFAYVTNYVDAGENEAVTVRRDQVYGCRSILKREIAPVAGTPYLLDYAIVRLDRPVSAEPIGIDSSWVEAGERVVAIGTSGGVPLKAAPGEVVRSESLSHYFEIDADTFSGNSGGPVVDQLGSLRGILVGGRPDDYVQTPDECSRVSAVAEAEALKGAEFVLRIADVIEAACAEGSIDAELCGESSRCGDDECATDEVDGCDDCAQPVCHGTDCLDTGGEQETVDVSMPTARGPDDAGCSVGSGRSGAFSPSAFLLSLLVVMVAHRRK